MRLRTGCSVSSRKNGTGRGGGMAICMALQERRPFDLKEGNMTKEDRGPMEDSKKFFEELYNEEFDEIVRYVRRMLTDSNAVEDVAQETFYEFYRKRKELVNHPNIHGWLRITAKNKVMKWEEKQRKYSLDFDFLLDNATLGNGSRVDDFKMVEAYSTVGEILSEEELELLRCYYEYGYTSQEMAKKLGITENCFKVRIFENEAENTRQYASAVFIQCLQSYISADYFHRRQVMTQGKGKRDEKLIEELYEKLYWYTYEASEEEFDDKEVDAIVRLLDVLDPKEDDPKFPSDPEAAFERFKSRYGLEEEFAEADAEAEEAASGSGMGMAAAADADVNAEAAGGGEEEAAVRFGGTDSIVLDVEPGADSEPDNGDVMESRENGKKNGVKWRRRLVRIATGAAACLVLMLSVNFGSYALKKKSFFEVVRDEVGRTKVTVTGNVDGIDDASGSAVYYSGWNEIESIVGKQLLKPQYMPENFKMENICIDSMESKKAIIARYNYQELYIRIEIDIYERDYSENILSFDSEWEKVDESNDGKVQYYKKNEQLEAYFLDGQEIYIVNTNVDITELKRIINNFKL